MKYIPLTHGKVSIVCDCHYPLVASTNWYYHKRANRGTGYAKNVHGSMHRLIMKAPRNRQVDHKDSNGLNNQCSNLRLATHAQNQQNRVAYKTNTSGYKGVTKDRGKWKAQIRINGKQIHLGLFADIHNAAQAYKEAATKSHGQFARY